MYLYLHLDSNKDNDSIADLEWRITKGRIATTLPRLGKQFSVKFQIKPTSFPRGYTSVLHMTTNYDGDKYGKFNDQKENYLVYSISGAEEISILRNITISDEGRPKIKD